MMVRGGGDENGNHRDRTDDDGKADDGSDRRDRDDDVDSDSKSDVDSDGGSASRLWSDGVAVVDLSPSRAAVARRAFRGFEASLPSLRSCASGCEIARRDGDGGAAAEDVDAHAVTGYHRPGVQAWSASSNLRREGMVWSRDGSRSAGGSGRWQSLRRRRRATGDTAPVEHEDTDGSDCESPDHGADEESRRCPLEEFREWSDPMEEMLLSVALEALDRAERRLMLPAGWLRRRMLFQLEEPPPPNLQEQRPKEGGRRASRGSGRVDRASPRTAEREETSRYYHQWHMKNYVLATDDDPGEGEADASDGRRDRDRDDDGETGRADRHPPTRRAVLLPAHTDPSLVSVVVLDRPPLEATAARGGVSGDGGPSQGLEYWNRARRRWEPVARRGESTDARGGGAAGGDDAGDDEEKGGGDGLFAIVFIGSVLSYLTGGYLHAPLHRVVADVADGSDPASAMSWHRRAATLFLRPAPAALLQAPPSSRLEAALASSSASSSAAGPLRKLAAKGPVTFQDWNSRVSKNYRRRRSRRDESSAPPSEGPRSETNG